MPLSRRLVLLAVLVVTAVAVLLSGYFVLQLLMLEARGGIDGIAYIFVTVGRGILNGLKPYADLYDSKPPGMYVVTVLSLLLSGDHRVGVALQIALFLLLPLLPAAYAYTVSRRRPTTERILLTALGFLLGSLLFFYLETRTGGYMAESFGACIGSLYLLHVMLRRNAAAPSAFLLNTLLLSGTYGFKEPFILSMIAGTLLVARDAKHFRTAFLYPLLLSCVLGTALLATLGWLGPYFSYVHNMVGARIFHGRTEALWMRGFAIARLMGNVMKGYGTPFFGVLVGSLILIAPACSTEGQDRRLWTRTTLAMGTACALILAAGIAIIANPDYPLLLPVGFPLPFSSIVLRLIAAGIGIGLIVLLLFVQKPGLGIVRVPAALMLACMAVGVAEYQPTHFGFVVPFLFAITLVFLRYAAAGSLRRLPVVIIGCLTLLTALTYRPTQAHLNHLHTNTVSSERVDATVAKRFDAMMASCGFTHYFNDELRLELALSRLSPIGPLFVVGEHSWYLAPDAPLLQDTIRNIQERAQVFAMHEHAKWKMNNAVWGAQWGNMFTFFPELEELFTDEAPDCAKPFLPFEHMRILFRKGDLPQSAH